MPKQKDFFSFTEGFLRLSHLSIFTQMYQHLDGLWDIFWIKLDNDTFTALQMKAFGSKIFKLHARVKKCHFGNFSKTLACNVIWSAVKVSSSDFFRNMSQGLSKCLSMWIKVDKWHNLKKPSVELKNYFCFGIVWIPQRPGTLNYKRVFFWPFKKILKKEMTAMPRLM